MQIEDVPQEGNSTHPGERKAIYALNRNGEYEIVPSQGWKVEELVTTDAIRELELKAAEALQRVKDGISSPLEYYMYSQRLDVTLLAQSLGFWKWKVRRHLSPSVFARLPLRTLQVYADFFGVSVDKLKRVE